MAAPHLVAGPAVVVPGRVAAILSRHVDLDHLALTARGQDREVDEVLNAWRAVVQLWRAGHGTPLDGRDGADDADGDMRRWMDSDRAAEVLDVTSRAVRGLAARGRLHGRKVAGRWVFHDDDVHALAELGQAG